MAPNFRQAIFRVIAAGGQFAFTRMLVVDGERIIEQFGPSLAGALAGRGRLRREDGGR